MISRNSELREEVMKGLKVLEKMEIPLEVRMLKTKKGTRSGYYIDKDKLLSDIQEHDGVDNIFFTLNVFSDDLMARAKDKLLDYAQHTTSDSDIIRRKLLLIDIDPCRASGISSTDEELEYANKVAEEVKLFLNDNEFPQPVKACSGNGYHLLYKLDLPNTKEVTENIKVFLQVLDNKFSTEKAKVDTTNYNPARITKLYGTIACKGDSIEGRPHRRSKIVEIPEKFEVVNEALINKIAELMPKKENKTQAKKQNNTSKIQGEFDVKEWLDKHGIEIHRIKEEGDRKCHVLKQCPWNCNHTDTSASVTQFKDGGISAICHHDSCSEENWESLRELYEPKAKRKKSKVSETNPKEEKKSQADIMIEMAMKEEDEFFHDELNEKYVAIKRGGNPLVLKINGQDYKSFLVKRFFKETKKAPSKDSINQAVSVLEALAQYDGEEINVAKRCTERDGAIYYDLGDKEWSFIKITKEGWKIDNSGQILFTRRKTMKPQVLPEEYDDISIINKHYRFKTDEDKILHTVSTVTKFLSIGNPIIVYHGEKGASKTTTMRMDRSIVDPSARDVISMPKSATDLSLVLHNNYLPCFDNIDSISAEKSDILCTAATGGGFSRRKLYTDDEENIYEYKVPVILNGINVVATRPDLLDRSLLLGLERISEDERKEESEVWEEFNRDKPKMLGAIFSTISKALTIYPNVKLKKLGRMADFTRWGYAIAEACGIGGEKFLKAYLNNQYKANDEAVSSNPIATAIIRLMEKTQHFEGSASRLLEVLNSIAEDEKIDIQSKLWAKEPNVLSRRLNELKSNLLMEGITFSTSNTSVGRKIEIRKSPKELIGGQSSTEISDIANFIQAESEVIDF